MSVTRNPCSDGRDKTFREIRENGAYFLANYDGLMARYPNQRVAIHGQRVAGAAADYFEAEAQLKAQGIAHNEALWEYLAADRNYYITSLWDSDDD